MEEEGPRGRLTHLLSQNGSLTHSLTFALSHQQPCTCMYIFLLFIASNNVPLVCIHIFFLCILLHIFVIIFTFISYWYSPFICIVSINVFSSDNLLHSAPLLFAVALLLFISHITYQGGGDMVSIPGRSSVASLHLILNQIQRTCTFTLQGCLVNEWYSTLHLWASNWRPG